MLPLIRGGRCAGRNPPSVLSGIQLYGLPGSSRRQSQDPYSPFHPAGSAVSPDPRASSTLPRHHRSALGGLVSVRCQGSPPTPRGVAVLRGGWSFLRPWARRPPTGSPTKNPNTAPIYNLYSPFCGRSDPMWSQKMGDSAPSGSFLTRSLPWGRIRSGPCSPRCR